MAAVVTTVGRIGVPAILGFLRRNQTKALLSAVGLGELVDFLQSSGNDAEKARLPQFAIVDLKRDEVIMPLSKKRVFRLLTRPSRPRTRTKTIVIGPNARKDITGTNVEVIR